jgi:hypothetical protein
MWAGILYFIMRSLIAFLWMSLSVLPAQSARLGERSGKALMAAPMIGAGTWEDPRRPAFVQEARIPFQYQVSDDGTMALVEASPRNRAEMAKLEGLVKNDARAKIFRPEKDKKSDVEAEFKKLKKDFDPELFRRLGPQVTPSPAPGSGK